MSAIPTVGSIVHYASHGTPGGEYPSACRAAIVTAVDTYQDQEPSGPFIGHLSLAVLNPEGMYFNWVVQHDENDHRGGTWHWPEGGIVDASPATARRLADDERYEALRRDVAEMADSLRQLTARPKTDLGMRISLPEDLDAEKVQRELRFAFGLCRDCGKQPCVCLRSAPCSYSSHEIEHDAHAWDAPVDGHVHCPGWGAPGDTEPEPGERSLMDDLPARLHPLAAAVGIPDRPVDPRERAREWIVGFYATTDEDRVNCVALLLGAADDALRCAVNHKGRNEDEQGQG